MDFLRPPTDNLYKFLAISGLVLIVVSIIFPIKYADEVNLETANVSRQIESILTDSGLVAFRHIPFKDAETYAAHSGLVTKFSEMQSKEELSEQLAVFHDLEIELIRKSNIPDPNDDDAKRYWMDALKIDATEYKAMASDPEGDNLLNRTIKSSRQVLKDVRKLPLLANEQWNHVHQAYTAILIGEIVIGFGVVLTAAGFFAWYFRVQRYQDVILRAESQMPHDKDHPSRDSAARRAHR